MTKFCGRCGHRLNKRTGLCPKCDVVSSKYSVLKIIITILLVVTLAVSFMGCVSTPLQEEETHPTKDTTIVETETLDVETEEVYLTEVETMVSSTEEATYIEFYTQIIEGVERNAIDPERCVGQLCDMDDDGTPELALSYLAVLPEGHNIKGLTIDKPTAYFVFDLYTVQNGEAVKLLDQEPIGNYEEGSIGAFAFAETEQGKELFVKYNIPGDSQEAYFSFDGNRLYCIGSCDVESTALVCLDAGMMFGRRDWVQSVRLCNSGINYLRTDTEWVDYKNGEYLDNIISQMHDESWKQQLHSAFIKYPVGSIYPYHCSLGSALVDEDKRTNGTAKVGSDEYVQFGFREEYKLEKMYIWIGNNNYYENFAEYARPKSLTVTFSDGCSRSFFLLDQRNAQILELASPVFTSSVKLTIDTV